MWETIAALVIDFSSGRWIKRCLITGILRFCMAALDWNYFSFSFVELSSILKLVRLMLVTVERSFYSQLAVGLMQCFHRLSHYSLAKMMLLFLNIVCLLVHQWVGQSGSLTHSLSCDKSLGTVTVIQYKGITYHWLIISRQCCTCASKWKSSTGIYVDQIECSCFSLRISNHEIFGSSFNLSLLPLHTEELSMKRLLCNNE